MKSRPARLGALVVTAGLLSMAAPAEATWTKTVTFTGMTTLTGCPGLGTPITHGVPTTSTTTKPDPKGVTEVNTRVLNGNTCNFTFTSTTCVKTSTGKKTGNDLCTLSATGTITGFCGMSSGAGTMTLTNTTGTVQPKPSVTTSFKFSETNFRLRVSGGNATQNVNGSIGNTPVTGSCPNKTATGFLWDGTLEFKRIT